MTLSNEEREIVVAYRLEKALKALEHAHLLAILYQLAVRRIDVTFAERQVMDGVQQVGFPHPVVPEKAINLV